MTTHWNHHHVAVTSCGCTPFAFNAAISIGPTENSPALLWQQVNEQSSTLLAEGRCYLN